MKIGIDTHMHTLASDHAYCTLIEMLDYAKDEKQLNIYLNHLWEATKEIRNIVGSPNSRKKF